MDTPLLNDLTEAAAEAQPAMPVSMMPNVGPVQWQIQRVTAPDGTPFTTVTIHQPNNMTHLVLNDEDMTKLVGQIQEQLSGLTIAKTMP